MQKSNRSEKSRGILTFAFNTQSVDYVSIASKTARLAAKHMGLPITLVTDDPKNVDFTYDKIIEIKHEGDNWRVNQDQKTVEWKNFGRYLAYDLSPYDETVLLDVDYLVLDDSLLKMFEIPFSYKLMHGSRTPKDSSYNLMGSLGLPFVWATVILFRKAHRTQQYFDLAGRIQRNYAYYKTLFNCTGNYRNDYVFAMANIILNGYQTGEDQSIPGRMLTIEDKLDRLEANGNFLIASYPNYHTDVISRQNLHIMHKEFLLSHNFSRFVESETV